MLTLSQYGNDKPLLTLKEQKELEKLCALSKKIQPFWGEDEDD